MKKILAAMTLLFVIACEDDKPLTYEYYKDKPVSEIPDYGIEKRNELYADAFKHRAADFKGADINHFNSCLSDMRFNKAATTKFDTIIDWCAINYKNRPKAFANTIDYDVLKQQFSSWDGSHHKLESLIKAAMNDPDSFEHDKTTYRLEVTDEETKVFVKTVYRGKNAYGAVVKGFVYAQVDPVTGDVIKVLGEG